MRDTNETTVPGPSGAMVTIPDRGTRDQAERELGQERIVKTLASGTFDVKLSRLPTSDTTEGSPLARMSFDKQFHGDLEGIGRKQWVRPEAASRAPGSH